MSRRPALLSLVLLTLSLAGCLSDDDGKGGLPPPPVAVPADWWVDVLPSSLTDEEHDHGNRTHHADLTTANFEVIGYDPLITDHYGTTITGMGCGGAVTREDGRRLAIVHSISTQVSFVVADVTDPAAPRMQGEFYLPNAVVWDADISADGEHVLIGAYPPGPVFGRDVTLPEPPSLRGPPTGELDALRPAWSMGHEAMVLYRDACTGRVTEAGPANYLPGPAIVMVGIQDPEAPAFEDYVAQPVIGPHSVGSQAIDGTVYATSSVTNLAHEGSYYTFFEIVETAAGGRLVTLSVLETPGHPTQQTVTTRPGALTPWLNGHTDVYLHKHPKTGQLLAYLANWDGMYVYDLSIPNAPLEVSVWADGNAGSLHTTYPFPTLRDDRQYLIAAQEVGEPVDLPSGWVYILDVTDPEHPTEVSRWTLPVKPKWDWGSLQFSPHYVAILNTTMFVSNYHGGLWAVDIANITAPAASGIFVPARDSPVAFGGGSYGPSVEDVIVDPTTGVLTSWDGGGGIYQLRFLEAMAAPRAPAWDPSRTIEDG